MKRMLTCGVGVAKREGGELVLVYTKDTPRELIAIANKHLADRTVPNPETVDMRVVDYIDQIGSGPNYKNLPKTMEFLKRIAASKPKIYSIEES